MFTGGVEGACILRMPFDVIIEFFGNCWIEAAIIADAREAAETADLDAEARLAAALELAPLPPEDDPSENVGTGWGSS